MVFWKDGNVERTLQRKLCNRNPIKTMQSALKG